MVIIGSEKPEAVYSIFPFCDNIPQPQVSLTLLLVEEIVLMRIIVSSANKSKEAVTHSRFGIGKE